MLPNNLTVKARHWTHKGIVPELTDPFNPMQTNSVLRSLSVPLPKSRACHYGRAFSDVESSVQSVYVGVSSNSSADVTSDDVVAFTHAYDVCHACVLPCDALKCDVSCEHLLQDGFLILPIHFYNLTLDPGSYIPDPSTGDPVFDPNRFHVLAKVINSAGLETTSASAGIKIDLTPPDVITIEAVDPGFDPLYPATHQGQTHSLGAWWDIKDVESDVREFFVSAGTAPYATDISDYVSVGLNFSATLSDLKQPLMEGETYYFNVKAENFASMQTIVSTTGITVLTQAPDLKNVTISVLDAVLWQGENTSLWVTSQQDTFGLILDLSVDNFTNIVGTCMSL